MKLISDKRLFLIDTFIYIYKYYYYYNQFYKKNSILFGLVNFIINILIKKKPTYIIFVFDGKINKNYKKKYFINYKNNRKKIEINKDIYRIKKILYLLNIQYINIKNIEADDIIGSIITYSEKKGYINYIYTEDKDYYQLISNNTFIIKKNIIINKNYILIKYNIKKINQYIDLISLIGDKSDNIPGIPYIGIKTASNLLNKYKNVENIFLNINNLEKNIKNKIKYYKYLVLLSKKMIKINRYMKYNIIKKIIYRKKIYYIKFKKILYSINKYLFNKKINLINKYLYL
ncbi:MAG: hypothetical protein NHG00_00865 [Candidatus Shikimatogenerans sp. JK-2022]|nr:hypothetical protein [Candidatus Shikimatogenerans bostrichidophilus]